MTIPFTHPPCAETQDGSWTPTDYSSSGFGEGFGPGLGWGFGSGFGSDGFGFGFGSLGSIRHLRKSGVPVTA